MRKPSYNGSDSQRIRNKTMTLGSNFRFENLQRLNNIVGEVTQRNNKQSTIKNDNKIDTSGKVLDMIKNRIKTNCERLYENYDQNKKVILKQIQQVETSMLSQNQLNKGFESMLKDKSNYDKAKNELQAKQKKLKKLIQTRDQLKQTTQQSNHLVEVLEQKCQLIQQFQQYRQSLQYQTSILNSMKSQRRQIKLHMKQKYDRMLADQQFKKQRIKKLQNLNHVKIVNLKKIEEQLKRQEHCEIPEQLAGQLQRKLQQYEGKNIYQNIVKHEAIISQQFRRQTQLQQARQKQEQRKQRLIRQKEEQKQYQLAYNFYLIKQQQQQKIKRICGVSSLGQIVNNSLENDCQNLQLIKRQTQKAIKEIRQKNVQIAREIEGMLTGGKGQQQAQSKQQEEDLFEVESQLLRSEKQLKGMELNAQKKYQMMDQWHRLVQMMTNKEVKRQYIGESLKHILQTLSTAALQNSQQQRHSKPNSSSLEKNNKMQDSLLNNNMPALNENKQKLISQQQSNEYSIIDDKSFQ